GCLVGERVSPRRVPHRRCRRRRSVVGQDHQGLYPRRRHRDPVPGPHPPTVANRDPQPPHHRRLERTHRGTQPGHQEGETSRPRLPKIRPLPTPLPPPRRRNQLAQPTLTTPNPNTPIPTRMRRAGYPALRDLGGSAASYLGGGLSLPFHTMVEK